MTLAEEAQLYLAVVEAFRAEGCEPHWRPEPTVAPIARPTDAQSVIARPRRTRRRKTP